LSLKTLTNEFKLQEKTKKKSKPLQFIGVNQPILSFPVSGTGQALRKPALMLRQLADSRV